MRETKTADPLISHHMRLFDFQVRNAQNEIKRIISIDRNCQDAADSVAVWRVPYLITLTVHLGNPLLP